jgi:hypothetical protein
MDNAFSKTAAAKAEAQKAVDSALRVGDSLSDVEAKARRMERLAQKHDKLAGKTKWAFCMEACKMWLLMVIVILLTVGGLLWKFVIEPLEYASSDSDGGG